MTRPCRIIPITPPPIKRRQHEVNMTCANRRHSIFAASVPLVWDIQSPKVGKFSRESHPRSSLSLATKSHARILREKKNSSEGNSEFLMLHYHDFDLSLAGSLHSVSFKCLCSSLIRGSQA